MFTFTSEFFLGVLIGFVLGMICNSQLHNMRILSKTMKSRKLPITKRTENKIYLPDVETLWRDLRQLYDKRTESDPNFSFNKMAFEIHKLLLGEGKAVAASTIRNFYLRRTTPRKKSIMAIQCWIDKEKENGNHEDDEIIDDSDNIINNSDSKEDNEI